MNVINKVKVLINHLLNRDPNDPSLIDKIVAVLRSIGEAYDQVCKIVLVILSGVFWLSNQVTRLRSGWYFCHLIIYSKLLTNQLSLIST